MNLEHKIIEDITSTLAQTIDYSKYEVPVQKAVDAYFKSTDFKDMLGDALSEQGLEWDIADKLAKEFKAQLRKKK